MVSEDGRILSLKKKHFRKEMCQMMNGHGYKRLRLCQNGVKKGVSVHRLVATAFVPNPLNKTVVNHKDGNKLNNHYTNLEWVTSSENQKHAYDLKLKTLKGIAKFSESDIRLIRSLYKEGITNKSLSERFNTSTSNMCAIVNNKTWIHLI